MDSATDKSLQDLALAFETSRPRLRHIAALKLNHQLSRLIGVDDIVQETWVAICARLEHFQKSEDIPLFVRFRAMLLQTITDIERKYLVCQKRDLAKSVSFDYEDPDKTREQQRWNALADTITSPRTRLARQDRHVLLLDHLARLPEDDKNIIELRHFENLRNKECATVLVNGKNISIILYVRALKRLNDILLE